MSLDMKAAGHITQLGYTNDDDGVWLECSWNSDNTLLLLAALDVPVLLYMLALPTKLHLEYAMIGLLILSILALLRAAFIYVAREAPNLQTLQGGLLRDATATWDKTKRSMVRDFTWNENALRLKLATFRWCLIVSAGVGIYDLIARSLLVGLRDSLAGGFTSMVEWWLR